MKETTISNEGYLLGWNLICKRSVNRKRYNKACIDVNKVAFYTIAFNMNPAEIALHVLIEHHVAPYGYAIVNFQYFDQDSYYKVRLERFDKTHPITLIIFPEQLRKSVKDKQLLLSIAEKFRAELPVSVHYKLPA